MQYCMIVETGCKKKKKKKVIYCLILKVWFQLLERGSFDNCVFNVETMNYQF